MGKRAQHFRMGGMAERGDIYAIFLLAAASPVRFALCRGAVELRQHALHVQKSAWFHEMLQTVEGCKLTRQD